MTTPIIGITTRQIVDEEGLTLIAAVNTYIQAVIRAGGLPLLIPIGIPPETYPTLMQRIDGLLLTGGADIDPEIFNGEPHPRVYGINPERDALELQLAKDVVHSDLPFLGICRGFQVLNVALGGSLYTHLPEQFPSQVKHNHRVKTGTKVLAHSVTIAGDTCLADIVGAGEMQVNSLHHQGAKEIAPSLSVSARAEDGLVEGLELPGHPFGIAVQWHPEWLPEIDRMQAIFHAFVQAAAQHSS